MNQPAHDAPRAQPAPKHILVATDFSDPAERALLHALALAKAFGARLSIIHVVPEAVPVPASGPLLPGAPIAPPAISSSERQDLVRPRLESVLDRCRAEAVPVDGELLSHAGTSLYHPIVETASERSADLIVMGTHGRSGLDRLLLGSVTEGVIRHSRIPVLAVPDPGP